MRIPRSARSLFLRACSPPANPHGRLRPYENQSPAPGRARNGSPASTFTRGQRMERRNSGYAEISSPRVRISILLTLPACIAAYAARVGRALTIPFADRGKRAMTKPVLWRTSAWLAAVNLLCGGPFQLRRRQRGIGQFHQLDYWNPVPVHDSAWERSPLSTRSLAS